MGRSKEAEMAARYPMFAFFGLDIIAARTGYGYAYLVAIMNGTHPANPRFRRICSERLGKSEAELFGEVKAA